MSPVVEILFAPANEAYRNDPSLLNPCLEFVKESKGSLGIYHGVTIEDPNQLVVFVVWETIADHQALMDDKVRYPKLGEAFSKCGDLSKGELFHVHFEPEGRLEAILNSTYVSYAHSISLKEGKTTTDVEAPLKALSGLPLAEGCHGGNWGKAVEKDEHVTLYGWDHPKYHLAVMTRPESAKILAEVKEIVDKHKWGHVKFNVYKKYEA